MDKPNRNDPDYDRKMAEWHEAKARAIVDPNLRYYHETCAKGFRRAVETIERLRRETVRPNT